MAETVSYLAIVEGDDGIPLWRDHPTRENIPTNSVVIWLKPYSPCIVVMDYEDETSLVIYEGLVCFAVTACLFEI